MIPGPPPVQITLCRSLRADSCAPPSREAIAPNSRAAPYQRRWSSEPSSRIRAEPNTTMVERTPQARSASSGLANSISSRTPRMEGPMMKSASSGARR